MTSSRTKGDHIIKITESKRLLAKQIKKQADTDPESKTQTHRYRYDIADKTQKTRTPRQTHT